MHPVDLLILVDYSLVSICAGLRLLERNENRLIVLSTPIRVGEECSEEVECDAE